MMMAEDNVEEIVSEERLEDAWCDGFIEGWNAQAFGRREEQEADGR